MDPMGLAGMLFTLILVGMIGGFILLLPTARRLGAFLELRLQERSSEPNSGELRRLEASMRALQEEMVRLSERQAFAEALLSERDPLLLPKDVNASGAERGAHASELPDALPGER